MIESVAYRSVSAKLSIHFVSNIVDNVPDCIYPVASYKDVYLLTVSYVARATSTMTVIEWIELSRVGFAWCLLNIPKVVVGAITLVS
jgi:hypothetical protein